MLKLSAVEKREVLGKKFKKKKKKSRCTYQGDKNKWVEIDYTELST